jgi:hypothetical protein
MNDDRLLEESNSMGAPAPAGLRRHRTVRGVSLLIVAAILICYDVWWGVLLVPVAAVTLYAAYCFPRAIRVARTNSNPRSDDARTRAVGWRRTRVITF